MSTMPAVESADGGPSHACDRPPQLNDSFGSMKSGCLPSLVSLDMALQSVRGFRQLPPLASALISPRYTFGARAALHADAPASARHHRDTDVLGSPMHIGPWPIPIHSASASVSGSSSSAFGHPRGMHPGLSFTSLTSSFSRTIAAGGFPLASCIEALAAMSVESSASFGPGGQRAFRQPSVHPLPSLELVTPAHMLSARLLSGVYVDGLTPTGAVLPLSTSRATAPAGFRLPLTSTAQPALLTARLRCADAPPPTPHGAMPQHHELAVLLSEGITGPSAMVRYPTAPTATTPTAALEWMARLPPTGAALHTNIIADPLVVSGKLLVPLAPDHPTDACSVVAVRDVDTVASALCRTRITLESAGVGATMTVWLAIRDMYAAMYIGHTLAFVHVADLLVDSPGPVHGHVLDHGDRAVSSGNVLVVNSVAIAENSWMLFAGADDGSVKATTLVDDGRALCVVARTDMPRLGAAITGIVAAEPDAGLMLVCTVNGFIHSYKRGSSRGSYVTVQCVDTGHSGLTAMVFTPLHGFCVCGYDRGTIYVLREGRFHSSVCCSGVGDIDSIRVLAKGTGPSTARILVCGSRGVAEVQVSSLATACVLSAGMCACGRDHDPNTLCLDRLLSVPSVQPDSTTGRFMWCGTAADGAILVCRGPGTLFRVRNHAPAAPAACSGSAALHCLLADIRAELDRVGAARHQAVSAADDAPPAARTRRTSTARRVTGDGSYTVHAGKRRQRALNSDEDSGDDWTASDRLSTLARACGDALFPPSEPRIRGTNNTESGLNRQQMQGRPRARAAAVRAAEAWARLCDELDDDA